MRSTFRDLVTHPALAICGALLAGLFEVFALWRSRGQRRARLVRVK